MRLTSTIGQLRSWRHPYGSLLISQYRTQVLPGTMDVSGTDLAEIRSMSRAGVATTVPPDVSSHSGEGT